MVHRLTRAELDPRASYFRVLRRLGPGLEVGQLFSRSQLAERGLTARRVRQLYEQRYLAPEIVTAPVQPEIVTATRPDPRDPSPGLVVTKTVAITKPRAPKKKERASKRSV